MPRISVAALTLICTALTAGCSGDDGSAEQTGNSADKTVQATDSATKTVDSDIPKIKVSADKTHAVQPNDKISLTISVDGFSLDPTAIGQPNAPGKGHYRVYLDEAGGGGFLAEGTSSTIQIVVPPDITDGSHELRVMLVNNDSSPLDPPVEGSVLLIVYRL